jgi:DNA invertase Pin-like site-specific DNA recombinase
MTVTSRAKRACPGPPTLGNRPLHRAARGVEAMEEEENWRPLAGYDGLYFVSDTGLVASVILMAMRADGGGYLQLNLRRNGKPTRRSIHRLVWEAFHGDIPVGMEINHKNGVKRDNRLANLELVTPSENMLHAFRTLKVSRNRLKGATHPKARLTENNVRDILALRRSGVRRYIVAKKYNISATAIRLIETGRSWRHLTGIEPGNTSVFVSPSGMGSSNPRAKLAEADIPTIFHLCREGLSQTEIAKRFGVGQQTICKVLLGQQWRHLLKRH